MKVFVWQRVSQATGSYHTEGGVVVFAADENRARALANAQEGCAIAADEMPDDVRESSGVERVFIMKDVGCCQ